MKRMRIRDRQWRTGGSSLLLCLLFLAGPVGMARSAATGPGSAPELPGSAQGDAAMPADEGQPVGAATALAAIRPDASAQAAQPTTGATPRRYAGAEYAPSRRTGRTRSSMTRAAAAGGPEAEGATAAESATIDERGDGKIALNFDHVDVNVVIATIAELAGIPYVVDPGVQGTVTIRTARGLDREDLLPVLDLILEVNNLTAVREGDFHRITPSQDASRLPIPLRFQTEGEPGTSRKEVLTQIIPLEYVSVGEMSKLVEPFLSPSAMIIVHEGSNTLLVVDTATNVTKALQLVKAFDTSLLEEMNYRFFFLENADAEETVAVLREVFAPADGRAEGLKFIPINRLQAFMVLGPDENMFGRIEQLLESLDAATASTEPRLHVYFVRNGTAPNLAELLEQVFANAVATGEGTGLRPPLPVTARSPRNVLTNPLLKSPGKRPAAAPAAPAEPAQTGASGTGEEAVGSEVTLVSTIRITADEIRNALIIEATATDYRVIMGVLDAIDVPNRQVLIEATVAEIDYAIISELGVEWEFLKGADFETGLVNLTSSGAGFTVAVGLANELRARLNALEQENKVNIINSPHVLASDNQEARIDVSQEIPVVSAETVVPSGGESIVTTTVQYRDTGVLLSVTPHINDRKLVSLDIYQEVSEQAESVVVAGQLYPSFFKRVVETTLTVEHGQTIVLGGLIRENRSKANSGVPCLVRLPLLGPLFGQRRNASDKTELIILLTPKVIVNRDEVDSVTEEFKLKVQSVIDSMEKSREAPYSPLLDDIVNPEK